MSNFIFNTKPVDQVEMFYCVNGKQDFIDEQGNFRVTDKDSPNIAAKCIQNKKSKQIQGGTNYYSYYIRMTPNSTLFNPVEKLSPIKDKRQFNFIDSTCKDSWVFKEVSKVVFDKYLNFLNTKKIAALKDIERDIV